MLNPCQTDFSCQGCGADFDNIVSLHDHIKTHKLSPEKYYIKYYPRVDLYTKEPLRYKSRESYFSNDFITRTNLKKWLQEREEIDGDLVRDYCRNWLLNRKNNKKLIYAPCHLELKTLIAPQIDYYNELFGSYSELCESVGLKNKFNYSIKPSFTEKGYGEVIVDTRESRPWIFDSSIKTIGQKLDFADYAPTINRFNVYIERKEICDWAGVMSKGFDRFRREMQRAKSKNAYVVIVIESKFSDLQAINYLPHTKYIKATPDFLFHRARELLLEFDNIQMVAVANRKIASELSLKIFSLTSHVREMDLQYLIDKNFL